MKRDENYSPFGLMPAPRVCERGELLYEFVKDHVRIFCELVDRGEYGVEARILHNEEHHISHTFAPWHMVPFATPGAAAIHWAEAERRAIEAQ